MCTHGHPHISSHRPLKTSSHLAVRIHVSPILTCCIVENPRKWCPVFHSPSSPLLFPLSSKKKKKKGKTTQKHKKKNSAFLRLLAVVLPFSSKIELNTVNKKKLSRIRRSESEVFFPIFLVSILTFRFFFNLFFSLFFSLLFFRWVVGFWEGH